MDLALESRLPVRVELAFIIHMAFVPKSLGVLELTGGESRIIDAFFEAKSGESLLGERDVELREGDELAGLVRLGLRDGFTGTNDVSGGCDL